MYTPTWAQYEDQIHNGTPEEQREALDKFTTERDKELKSNPEARQYEKDRRDDLAKRKVEWVKSREDRKYKENEQVNKFMKGLREMGEFESSLTPAPGYILVQVDKLTTEEPEQTDSGIFLPENTAETEPQTGLVIRVGGDVVLERNSLKSPVVAGERVLFKKFAGVNVTLAKTDYKLMLFTDILGVFDA